MINNKKLVEDWLFEHFPYHLRADKDIPKDEYVMMNKMLMSQGWVWIDNPSYQSFEDVMFSYTIPRDFYSGAGAPYCGYSVGALHPMAGGAP